VATNFLQAAGTNGFIPTPFNLQSTELNALANGSSAVSSVGGTSGAFTQSNTANAIWGEIALTLGTGTYTPSAGGYVAGWFLYSPDGGSSYETTASNTDLPRSPDFIIPVLTSYSTGGLAQASGIVRLPWWSFKVFTVNHSGATLPATGNLIKLGPVAIQY
jgi:hypothetical protein